jgi:tryptophanase
MNTEALKLVSDLIQESGVDTPVALLELVTAMPITDEDKMKILIASNAVYIEMAVKRTDYLKNHLDKIEENLKQVTEDLKRIANLL